jgi:hypothetical protein
MMPIMRTTLTLADEIVKALKDLAHERGTSFKEVVNDVLRRGLSTPEPGRRRKSSFQVRTFHSAFRPGVDPAKLNQLIDDLDARESGR